MNASEELENANILPLAQTYLYIFCYITEVIMEPERCLAMTEFLSRQAQNTSCG